MRTAPCRCRRYELKSLGKCRINPQKPHSKKNNQRFKSNHPPQLRPNDILFYSNNTRDIWNIPYIFVKFHRDPRTAEIEAYEVQRMADSKTMEVRFFRTF